MRRISVLIAGWFALLIFMGPVWVGLAAVGSEDFFQVRVVDSVTKRGIPLVKLRTTNQICGYTDSNGVFAFFEPGLMDRDVFFVIESDGYEFKKDGFGYAGKALRTTPGSSVVLEMERINIAERLYRVTGQGIYRDSLLTGFPVPLEQPLLNGQVVGQDSVDNAVYNGRLFWLWGDTAKPSYPLGHFKTAGAFSDLPGAEFGGLDPAVGVDLEYFVGADGFSRPICPLPGAGMIWMDGLLTQADQSGRERMVARYARMKSLGEASECGLALWNDDTLGFEAIYTTSPGNLPYSGFGHVFPVTTGAGAYHYFATPFPLTVRLRVPARFEAVIDIEQYEVLTTIKPLKTQTFRSDPIILDPAVGDEYHWVRFGDLYGEGGPSRSEVIEALAREKRDFHLLECETGAKIVPHGGSVFFNAYLKKWIMIFVRKGGTDSFLGEVYFASAKSPVGPWSAAIKIATHHDYSFYNPKQHPYFDEDGGRTIFFEGTYTHTFSGSEGRSVPRYDYNQLMYRLDLSDPRLAQLGVDLQ